MKRLFSQVLMVLLASAILQPRVPAQASPAAQGPQGRPAAPPELKIEPPHPQRPAEADENGADEDVVRITSNLVQFDAVVTDKNGTFVTDLGPEEFEILVDGRPQQITNFSYVSNESAAPAVVPKTAGKASAAPVPPVRLRPEQVKRTVAVVVDDLNASWESITFTRGALKKFVDEQMRPGDLVAIITTRGGTGALRQFTSDKRLLHAAIRNLRWMPCVGCGGIYPFPRVDGLTSAPGQDGEQRHLAMQRERFTVATLGTLQMVAGGLGRLPGRKSLIFIADGLPLRPDEESSGSDRVMRGLNSLIEAANRAAVNVYTVDSRGLQTLGLYDAGNSFSGFTSQRTMALMGRRGREMFNSQRGMVYLAEETGGVAFRNANNIGGSLRRALEDQKGYYLIGYRPEPGTFDRIPGSEHFHKFTAKVRRPGLKVRTRTGFFGFTDRERGPSWPRTRTRQMANALTSPFDAGDVTLRLTSLFGNDPQNGSFMRSLLHIDGGDLTFTEEPDGQRKSVIDVAALTFGADGRPIGEANVTHTLRIRPEDYERVLRSGIVYNMVVPTKRPGAYQLRVAVRDAGTGKVGSASEYVEVPDLKKGHLALSGIMMWGAAPVAAQAQAVARSDGEAEASPTASDLAAGPAVRRFRPGTTVDYLFNIHNAKLDRSDGRPRLQTQVRLFREGQLVHEGPARPFDARPQNAAGDIGVNGQLLLGAQLVPGDYVLQIVVTDLLAKEKQRVAAQWIDFEVVE